MKLIEIDGFGEIEFPDEMDDSAINVAIERDILKKPAAPAPVAPAPAAPAPRSASFPSPIQPRPVSIPGMAPLAQGPALIEGPAGLQEMPKPPASAPAIPFDPQMHAAGYEYFQNKFPMETPEAYAERQVNPTGHSRGVMESIGDFTTSMTDFAYRPLVNATGIKGDKTFPQEMGERVYAAKQSYLWKAIPDDEKAMLSGRAKAKLQKGITLSKDEELAIQQDAGFWESMQQFAQSAKDHPEATVRELAGEMLAEGPLFVVATRGVGSVLKTAAKARKAMYAKQADKAIHNKIMSGEISPATASRFRSRAETAQKIAQTEQALVKPGALSTIGEEVAEETLVEGAIEAAQAKAAGRDLLTPQQAAETAAAGLLGLGLGAGRNAMDTRIDAPTYRKKVQDRTVFTPGIENNPNIQDQLKQIASTADSPALKDQRFRIDSDKAAARRFTGAEAPVGYEGLAGEDETLVEAGRTDRGRIYLTPYADETTVPEELIHATQDRLRQDQAAMDLRRRIARWEQGVKAQAAEKGIAIPSGDELFAKTFNSHLGNNDPDVADLALPDDIIEDFGAYLGQKTAKGLRGQSQAKAPSIRDTQDDPVIQEDQGIQDDPVIPYDQDAPAAAEPPPMTKEEWRQSPFQLKKNVPEGAPALPAGLKPLSREDWDKGRQEAAQTPRAKEGGRLTEEALKRFGTTHRFEQGAFMTPSGDLLNFGQAAIPGSSSDFGFSRYDHEEIKGITDPERKLNRPQQILAFLEEGNIRLHPETGRMQLAGPPTAAQKSAIKRWAENFKNKGIGVEIGYAGVTKGAGFNRSYHPGTSMQKVFQDIDDHFSGKAPAELSPMQRLRMDPRMGGPAYQLKKDGKSKNLPASWQDDGEFVRFRPEEFPEDKLEVLNNRLRAAGYDMRGAQDVKEALQRRKRWEAAEGDVIRLDGDWADAVRATLGKKMPADTRLSPKKMAKRAAKAREVFGTTTNLKEAGWLLPEGDFLDFSGKRDGGTPGSRAYDHRDIYQANVGKDELEFEDFKKGGFIRVFPESSAFEIHAKPTPAQAASLRRWIDYHKGDAIPVDVGRGWGGIYPPKTSAVRILRDINDVLDGKTVEPPKYNPDIQGPRYQLKKDAKKAEEQKLAEKRMRELRPPGLIEEYKENVKEYSKTVGKFEKAVGKYQKLTKDITGSYPDGPRYQLKKDEKGKELTVPANVPTFYSALTKTIEQKMGGKGQPDEIMKFIKAQSGIRPEEIEWTGLEKFLESKKEGGKPVTKQEVLDYLKTQDIEVDELLRGPPQTGKQMPDPKVELVKKSVDNEPDIYAYTDPRSNYWEVRKVSDDTYPWEIWNNFRHRGVASDLEDAKGFIARMVKDGGFGERSTKWESYTLPGGKDYRELELTLPEDYYKAKYEDEKAPIPTLEIVEDEGNFWINRRSVGLHFDGPFLSREDAEKRLELLEKEGWGAAEPGPALEPFEYGTHFPEKNVLAFTRFKERKTRDGKRVLFIEEIQSDWFQKMRDEGAITPDLRKRLENIQNALATKTEAIARRIESQLYSALEAKNKQEDPDTADDETYKQVVKKSAQRYSREIASYVITGDSPKDIALASDMPIGVIEAAIKDVATAEETAKIKDWQDKLGEMRETLKGGAPDAPFKDTWHEMVLKRLLRFAAEEGFDAISWADGATHFKRWGGFLVAWKRGEDGKLIIKHKSQVGGNAGNHDLEAEAERMNDPRFKQNILVETDDFRAFKAETNGFLSTHQQKQLWKKMNATPEGHFVGRKEGYEFFYDKAIPQFLGKFAKKLDPEAKLDKMEVELDPPYIPAKARTGNNAVQWDDPESTAEYTYDEDEVEDEDVSGYYYWSNEGRRHHYDHNEALGGPYSNESVARRHVRDMVEQDYYVEEVEDPNYEPRFFLEQVEVDGEKRWFIIDQEELDKHTTNAKQMTLDGGEEEPPDNYAVGIVKAHDGTSIPDEDLGKGFDEHGVAEEVLGEIREAEGDTGKKWAVARGGEVDDSDYNRFDSESEAEAAMEDMIHSDVGELYHIDHHAEYRLEFNVRDPAGDVIETFSDESEASDLVDERNQELEDARAERKRQLRGNLIRQQDLEDRNGNRDWVAYDSDGDEIGVYDTQEEAVAAWRRLSGEGEEPRIEERFMQDQADLEAPKQEPFGTPGTFLSIPVTDKMKQIALGEGFPKYQMKKARKPGPQVGPQSHKHKMSEGVPGKGIDQMQGYISYDAKGNQDRSGFLAPLEEAYWKFVDEAKPVLKVEDVFEEELQAKDPKAKVNPEESIKYAIDRVRGSGGAARVYIEEKFAPIYRGGKLEGKKLEPLTSKQQQLLDEYLFVKRIDWLYAHNDEFTDAGMPRLKARQNLARIAKDPDFKLVEERAKMVWAYFKDLGYRKLQAGVWTPEEHAQITAEPNYVPLIRDWDKVFNRNYRGATGKGGGGGGKAFTSVNKLVRQISSESTRLPVPIVDPVTAAVMDTHIAAKEIAKMRVWNNVIDMTQQSKELKDWIIELPDEYEPKADEDVVSVRRENGIKQYLVPRELGEAVNGMGYEAIPAVVKWIANVSSVFKKYQVGRNLDFAFANLPRDQQESYFNTGKIPFQYMLAGAKHYFKEDKVYKDYMKLGGSMESGESGMRSSVEAGRKVRYGNKRYAGLDALPPSQRYKVGKKEVGFDDFPAIKKAMHATGRTLVAPLELFEKVGEISEMMSRLGTFEHLQKKGASKQEAIHGARQGTLDFGRIGAQMKTPNALVPFLNAAVQGTDRNFRTMKKDPLKAAARIAISGLIPAAAILAWNAQNPEYANIKAREKDYYWIIMKNKTGKEHWKLAKGHVQKLFVNPFQMALENHLGTSHMKGWEVALQTLQGLLPIDDVTSAVPPALAVPIEQAINKEMYWRSDIEKNQGLAPELRYDPWTSETAKKISKGIKHLSGGKVRYSPAKIEHLLGGFFGGFANNSLWMTDQFLRAAGIEVTRDMTIERAPVIRRVFGIAQDWKSDLETQLRTKRKEFLEAERAMGTAGKRGDQDENKAYLLELKKEMEDIAESLKAVRELQEKAKEEVRKNNGIREKEGN